MQQFTVLLCLALLSLSSAVSPLRPMPVAPENCNTTEFNAGLVLEEINKDREDGYIFSLLRVTDAHSQQARAGTIYYFTIDVLETSCPVISGKSWKDCEVRSFHQAVFGQCKAIMYVNLPWRRVKLYKYSCTCSSVPPKMIHRMCPDCPTAASDLTPFEEKAEKMVVEFNKEHTQAHYYKLLKVERASRAWMVGPSSYVEFSIKETNCTSSTANPADCHFLEKGKAHVGFCKGSEITQPGPIGEKVSVTCEIYDPKPVGHPAPDTKKEACDHGETLQHCHVKTDGATHRCRVEAYQKPGETTYTIESLNCDITAAASPEVLLPIMCPGCPTHISGNSDEVQTILKQAIGKYNKESNQADVFKVEQIIKATSQVVAGFKYSIEFKIQETNCSKTHHSHDCEQGKGDEHHAKEPCTKEIDWHKCHTKTGEGTTHTCKVEYWTQPWTKKKEIVSLDCSLPAGGSPAANTPTNCGGCPFPIPGNSEKLQPILKAALEKYNKGSNQAHLFKLGQIIKATSQVVSGTKYTIEFTIEETNCTAADIPTISVDCKADDGHHHHHEHKHCERDIDWEKCPRSPAEGVETLTCKAEILTRSWEKFIGITLDCTTEYEGGPAVILPSCPGCPVQIAGDSEELQPYLKQVIRKYNQETNKNNLFKLGQILTAKKQVVAGMKYIIEFTIEETVCSKAESAAISTECKTHEHHGHHEHGHGHSHEHGHGHGHGHKHHHHHKGHHGPGHHGYSSEEKTGSRSAGPVGSVQCVQLADAADVLPAPSLHDTPHHDVHHDVNTDTFPEYPGPLPFNPYKDPIPMPFPTVPSSSPSCPGEPKHSLPLILPLLPVP